MRTIELLFPVWWASACLASCEAFVVPQSNSLPQSRPNLTPSWIREGSAGLRSTSCQVRTSQDVNAEAYEKPKCYWPSLRSNTAPLVMDRSLFPNGKSHNRTRKKGFRALGIMTSLLLWSIPKPALAVMKKQQTVATAAMTATLTWTNMGQALALFALLGPLALRITTNSSVMARPLLTAAARCIVQLNLVAAWILTWLFLQDRASPWTVGWILATSLYAATEAVQRVQVRYRGLRRHLACSLVTSLAVVLAATAGSGILGRTATTGLSQWQPRTWIPVAGMLLGNAVTATSLAANTWTMSLSSSQRSRIEAGLARGATWREATAAVRQQVWQTALTPTLNALRVTGVVHIPGMMTGQLLAGQSAGQAAAYQTIILLLLGTTACTAVHVLLPLVARATVDTRYDRLRSQESIWIQEHDGDETISLPYSIKSWIKRWRKGWGPHRRNDRISDKEDKDAVLANGAGVTLDGTRTFVHWKDYRSTDSPYSTPSFSSSLSSRTSISTQNAPFNVLDVRDLQVPRAGVNQFSLQLQAGDRVGIRGPSGIGKSQLLRTLAGLEPMHATSCRLYGLGDWDMPSWRQRVALVAQESSSSAVLLPGTPAEYFRRITSFQSQKTALVAHREKALATVSNDNSTDSSSSSSYNRGTESDINTDIHRYTELVGLASDWGIPSTLLHRPWSTLSGGQAQRVLLAMAVSLKPDVLLLDESTGALDELTTYQVEASLKSMQIPLVLVSHDDRQLERFCNQVIDLVPAGPFTTSPQRRRNEDYGVFE